MRNRYQCLALALVLAFIGVASGQNYIVYAWHNGSISQVFRANSDFSQVTQLTSSAYSSGDPAISPDGLYVVYTREEGTDHRANLWIMNADGTGARQLTFNSAAAGKRAFMPCWHPNSQKVYYTQETTGPYAVIREVSINGSGDNVVVSSSSTQCYGPAINPANPTQLAYIQQATYSQNGVIRLRSLTSGTESTLLAANAAADYHLVFSPDGQYLLWSEQTDGSSQNFALRRMNLSTLATATLVPAASDLNIYGAYSVDGQYIYYSTTHGTSFSTTQFYRMPASGGAAALFYTQAGTGRGYLGNVGPGPNTGQPSQCTLSEDWESATALPNSDWGMIFESPGTNPAYIENVGNPGKSLNIGGSGHMSRAVTYNRNFRPDYSSGLSIDFDAFLVSSGCHYTDVLVGLEGNLNGWPTGTNHQVVSLWFNKNCSNVRNIYMDIYSSDPAHNEERIISGAYDSDAWNHGKIVVRADQRVEFYVNGNLLWTSTKTIDPAYSASTTLILTGQSAGGTARMDNLCLNQLGSTPGSGLVANWPFTGNANDISGYGNNGVVSGATLATGHDGASNSAYSMSNGAYIRVPNSASLNPTNQFTISAWINYRGGSPNPRIFSKARDNYGYEFGILESWYNGVRKLFVHLGGQRMESNGMIPVGSWHHVAVTKDNNAINFYIDGALDVSRPYSGTIANTSDDGYIGRQMFNNLCDCLSGDLDEVRIYNRALSAQEVNGLYGGGAVQPPVVRLSHPNGGEHWQVGENHMISWTLTGGPAEELWVDLSFDYGSTWSFLSRLDPLDSDGITVVPFGLNEGVNCMIRISSSGPGGSTSDTSDKKFALTRIANAYPLELYEGVLNLANSTDADVIPCDIRVFSEDYAASSDNVLETVVQLSLPGANYLSQGSSLDLIASKISLSLVDNEATMIDAPVQTLFYRNSGWLAAPESNGFEGLSLWSPWVFKELIGSIEGFGQAIKLAVTACDYVMASQSQASLTDSQKWLITARENVIDDFDIPDHRPIAPDQAIIASRFQINLRISSSQTPFEIVLQEVKCKDLTENETCASDVQNPTAVSIDLGRVLYGVSSAESVIGPPVAPVYPNPGQVMTYYSEVMTINATDAGNEMSSISKQLAVTVTGPKVVANGLPINLEVLLELEEPDVMGFWGIEQAEAWLILKDNNGSVYTSPLSSLYRWNPPNGQWYSSTEPAAWWDIAARYTHITFGLLLGFVPVIGTPVAMAYGAGMVFTESSVSGDVSLDQQRAIYAAQSQFDFYEIRDKSIPIGSASGGRRTKVKWYVPVVLDNVDDDIRICIGPLAISNQEFHKGYLSPRPSIVINPSIRTQHPSAMEFTAYCPVNLAVEFDGQVTDPSKAEITSSGYLESDFNGDGDVDSRVFLVDPPKGVYRLHIYRKADFADTSTFVVTHCSGLGRTVIVPKTRLGDINPTGYLYSTLDSGSIAGIVSSGGAPMQQVGISILNTVNNSMRSGVTGSDGRFRFDGVPNGLYSVLLSEPLGYTADSTAKAVRVHGLLHTTDFALTQTARVIGGSVLPTQWLESWANSSAGTIRSYIGNIPAGHTASNIVPSSIRLNGQVPIFGNTSRVRPTMAGFTGSVLEIAFSRQLAVQSLGPNPTAGIHTVLIAGDFTDGKKFIAAVDITLSTGAAKESVEEDLTSAAPLPTTYRLGDAHPNPFNPSTTIDLDLPAAGQVRLEVYNIMGQKVRTIVDAVLAAGTHSFEWDSTDDSGNRVASGVYLYRLQAGSFTETKKMVLMK